MLRSKKFLATMLFLLLCVGLSYYMISSKLYFRNKFAVLSTVSNPAADTTDLVKTEAAKDQPEEPVKKPADSKPKVITYVVKTGDTLSSIAGTYGVKVNTISESSGILVNSILKGGQQLRFPSVDGVIHKVASGETLWDIAQVYDVDVQDILDANEIASAGTLKIGQELIIPGADEVKGVLAQRKSSSVVAVSKTSSKKTATSSRGSAGIIWPLRGIITSVFGPRWGTIHKGIDIAAPTGTNVVAAMSGTVIYSGWESGYGNLVVIEAYNGLESYYGHNSKLVVKTGQKVSRGQLISKVGSTGDATGPHLHFEIRKGGVPVNPMGYLR